MSVPSRRSLDVDEVGEATVVTFTGDRILDERNTRAIGEQLFNLVDELGPKQILLNFANVASLSSAALGLIVTLNKKVKASGGHLALCNLAPQIAELLAIAKLVRSEDDPDAGLAGVASRLKPPKPSGGAQGRCVRRRPNRREPRPRFLVLGSKIRIDS